VKRLLELLVGFGVQIFSYLQAEKGEALLLLELGNRLLYSTLMTQLMEEQFWKKIVHASFSREYPSLFPLDRGPVSDDDISVLLPGVLCPDLNCWLSYYRAALRKVRWLRRCARNSQYLQQFASIPDKQERGRVAVGAAAASTPFSATQRPVYFVLLRPRSSPCSLADLEKQLRTSSPLLSKSVEEVRSGAVVLQRWSWRRLSEQEQEHEHEHEHEQREDTRSALSCAFKAAVSSI